MKRKVRIKSLPQGYHMMPDGTIMKDSAHMAEGGMVNKNLSPIPRGMANLEAEKGEVAMTDLGNTGMMGLYNIGGERHSNGGTPLNLDPGSFIYSDTRKMKIKDPEFLAKYGKTKPVTPAKLVKPFLAINDFTNTLYDQNADPIQKRTAQSMIDKYKGKAGEIAFYQEAMKGFPQGIPAVAEDYAEGVMGAPMMAYGGYLPKAQDGRTIAEMFNKDRKRFVKTFVSRYPELVNALNSATFNGNPDVMARKLQDNPQLLQALTAVVQGANSAPTPVSASATAASTPPPAIFAIPNPYSNAPSLAGNIAVPAGETPAQQTAAPSRSTGTASRPSRPTAGPSRSDKFQAINPDLLRVLSQAGLNPSMETADYSDQDRLEYDRVQSQIAGYPGMYEDAQKNLPGWVKRMESLGYDFADWKDAQGNFDLKSLKGQDPRVRSYQEWWNPRVDQFITEENEKRQNAGYPAFTEAEIKAIGTQKFSDPNDPNAQPGSKIDSRLGTYTTSRLLAEGKYPAKIVEDREIENKESKESITNQQAPDPGFQPWLQDLNNLRTATRNMLSENRYFGYAPRLPYRPMDAVYLDDTRQQQQIAGRARGTMEALGAFAGPARQASMASVISGQAGEQAANVASQIGNANVNIANTVEGNNARMMANTDAANAELAMNLYDKNVTTQEVFDEKMRRYRNLNTALKNNMLTNAYKTKAMNKINPLFQVMPGVGGDIVFNPGVSAASFNVDDYASQAERINNAYKSEIENIKSLGLSPEEQSKQLAKLQELRVQSLFGASAKSKGAAYDPTSYLYPGNPYGTGVGGQ